MNLTIPNIKEVISKLEDLSKNLDSKLKLLMERLADIGVDKARYSYLTAQYDGFNDVIVDDFKWVDDKTIVITASGQAITFIEFGSGVHYSGVNPKANEMGMVRGGYGLGHGNQDTWGYYGEPGTNGKIALNKNGSPKIKDGKQLVLTHGNPPSRSMYDAGKEMRLQIETLVKEIIL